MDKVLARASVTIEVVEDMDNYEAQIISTNGSILQPYDTSTTLIGTVLKNKVDITNSITNVKWTKWNPSKDNLIECPEWNERHKGESTIQISKDDVDSKSIFMFEAYNNRDELLCSSSISIIDVNDLLVSTKEPTNPYVGQLWIDDTKEPATIYVWNGYKWVVSGTVGAIAKNLLRNTNFFVDCKYWDVVGDTRDMYTPTPYEYLSHRFAKLNSNVMTDHTRGITQTTTDIINKNNEYSFQMLFYSKTDDETFSNKIRVNIYSVEGNGDETILYTNELEAIKKIQQLYARFKTTDYTEAIRVEILGEDTWRFNFSIAELALYNTWNNYPWTINPIDMNITNYTQEDLWNILSNEGLVQGIFSQTNPATGQMDYYINASLITAGKLLAQYMDLYNLKVLRRDDSNLPPTLEIDENGKVSIQSDDIKMSSGDSLLDISENAIRLGVDSKGNQSFFTLDEKRIIMEAQNINLHGYFTANNHFIIDTNGNMSAIDGNFEGTITGSTIQSHKEDPKFLLTPEGSLYAEDAYIKGTIEGSVIEGGTLKGGTIIAANIYSKELYDEKGNEIEPNFKLTADGVLTANEAEIRGRVSGAILEGTELMTSGGNFHVDTKGKLYAKEAEFIGSITSGGKIQGAELIGGTIRNESSTFTVSSEGDVTGAKIYGGQIGIGTDENGDEYKAFTVDQDGNCNISKGKITIGKNFSVSNSGNLVANDAKFTGNVNVDGIIKGNTVLVAPKIQSGDVFESSDFSVDEFGNVKGANLYGGSLSIGKINGTDSYNFTVDEFGNMIAKSGKFTGDILSGSKISGASIQSINGNFSISENGEIKGGSINIKDRFIVTPDGKMEAIEAKFSGEIKCGDNFSVTNDGFVTATGVDLTGTITATEGKIAGYEINGGKLLGSAVGMNANKSTGNESIAFWAGSNTPEKASFKVSHTGVLIAEGAKITGTISGSDIEGGSIIGSEIKIGPKDPDEDGVVNYYNFTVSDEGVMQIGGKGLQKIDDHNRSPLEITNSGHIYSTSSTKGVYTKISAGKVECKGLNGDETIIDQGILSAVNGSFKGSINAGSNITGSNIYGSYIASDETKTPSFSLDSSGQILGANIECNNLSADNEISTSTLIVDNISSKAYPKALLSNAVLHVGTYTDSNNKVHTADDDNKCANGNAFETLQGAINSIPKNMNGRLVEIQLEKNCVENAKIKYFSSGVLKIYFNGKTLSGYIDAVNCSASVYLLGGIPSDTDLYTGVIHPSVGIKTNSRTVTVNVEQCNYVSIQHMKIYGSDKQASGVEKDKDGKWPNKVNVLSQLASNVYVNEVAIVNAEAGFKAIYMGHIHSYSTSGIASIHGFQAAAGGKISFNNYHQANGKEDNTWYASGGQIWGKEAVDKSNWETGSATTSTTQASTTTTTKTVTYTSNYGDTYRRSVYNNWKKDGTVRQGDWGYGDCKGCWFFGDDFTNMKSKTVEKIVITFTRQSSSNGNNSAVEHKLYVHNYESRPSGEPSLSTALGTVSLSRGGKGTLTITDSTKISAIKNAKGIGLMHAYDKAHYSVCSGTMKVKFYYK